MRTLLFLSLVFGFSFIPSMMHADIYTTMKGIMDDMTEYVYFLEDSLDQEIVHVQADIITADGSTFSRTLHEGWTYGIAAFGDWRIKDLDITVWEDVDGEWVEVVSDDESDNHPVVTIAPDETNKYMIELSVYKWDEDFSAAHYGMLIYHEMK